MTPVGRPLFPVRPFRLRRAAIGRGRCPAAVHAADRNRAAVRLGMGGAAIAGARGAGSAAPRARPLRFAFIVLLAVVVLVALVVAVLAVLLAAVLRGVLGGAQIAGF